MKNWNLILRRTHLYLSLALMPWFLMYAISSVVFSHTAFFDDMHGGWQPKWTVRFDKEFSIQIPTDGDLRATARAIIEENDLPDKAFGVYVPHSRQLNIYLHDFWSSTRITYFKNEHRLLAEDSSFRWDHFLTGMHARGGFQQESWFNDLWAVTVDLFCLAMLIWIVTGLYMWWKLKTVRLWGWVALVGGLMTFVFLLMHL